MSEQLAQAEQRRAERLNEIRRTLWPDGSDGPQRGSARLQAGYDYALTTLLSLLWVESGPHRIQAACVLCNHPPDGDKASAPQAAKRFCASLEGSASELEPPPASDDLRIWAGLALAGGLGTSLDALNAALRTDRNMEQEFTRSEARTCTDLLAMAEALGSSATAEACVRILRMVHEGYAAGHSPSVAITLRAARALGRLPADSLAPLWTALQSADNRSRQCATPVIDHLSDPRAVPYLIRLVERRKEWPDSDVMVWSVLRAFARMRDRRALPALRRLASGVQTGWRGIGPWKREPEVRPGLEMAYRAAEVIVVIEKGSPDPEARTLLRASGYSESGLLLPAEDHAPEEGLLRPLEERPDS